jgi:hypothetical protein
MSSRVQAAFLRMVTDCNQNRHRYRPTWTVGQVVCLDCGKRAVCPVCVPQWPDSTSAFWLCPKHQPKEQVS